MVEEYINQRLINLSAAIRAGDELCVEDLWWSTRQEGPI